MFAIYVMFYNYCGRHQSLRVSPAIEAGLSNHIWRIEELASPLDKRSILHGLL